MTRFLPQLSGFISYLNGCSAPVTIWVHQERLTDIVDSFNGTASRGHTYSGAACLIGLIQLSPDNGTQRGDGCSGYNNSDRTLGVLCI